MIYAHEYLIGGILFVAGSVLFLPQYGDSGIRSGSILFIIGSLVYFHTAAREALEVAEAFEQSVSFDTLHKQRI